MGRLTILSGGQTSGMGLIALIAALVVFILAMFLHAAFSLVALGLALLTLGLILDRVWPGRPTP